MDAAEALLYIGQVVKGRYEIMSFRGSGAFSGAFESHDKSTGMTVIVKLLSLRSVGNLVAVNEFHDEIRFLKLLAACSNVVDIHDDGTFPLDVQVSGGSGAVVSIDVPFMVLDVAEDSLDALLAHRHRMHWSDRLGLYREIVKGAHQMHVERILHRDIKAENALVFVAPPNARLADLGRSTRANEAPRLPGNEYVWGRGDPRFAPPEYLWFLGTTAAIEHLRADLYLLGSLLFEIATAQGITSMALGDPRLVQTRAAVLPPELREQGFQNEIPSMRERYELAYETFRTELPSAIRVEATTLLRQLTDPDPSRRELARPFERLPLRWDMQWLLRKTDILIKRLATSSGSPRRRPVRGRP